LYGIIFAKIILKIPLYPPFSKGGKIRKMPFSKGEAKKLFFQMRKSLKFPFRKEKNTKSLPLKKGNLEGFP